MVQRIDPTDIGAVSTQPYQRFHLEDLESSLLYSDHFSLAGSGNGSGCTMMLHRMPFGISRVVKV